jgi:hypothetical protein
MLLKNFPLCERCTRKRPPPERSQLSGEPRYTITGSRMIG